MNASDTNFNLSLNGFGDFYSEEDLKLVGENEKEMKHKDLFLDEGREGNILNKLKLLAKLNLYLSYCRFTS